MERLKTEVDAGGGGRGTVCVRGNHSFAGRKFSLFRGSLVADSNYIKITFCFNDK
jgi:hypothetical protein